MVDTDKVIRLSDYVQLERAQKNANGSRFAYDAANTNSVMGRDFGDAFLAPMAGQLSAGHQPGLRQ